MGDFPVNSDYEQDVDLANLGENEDSQEPANIEQEQEEAARQRAAGLKQRTVGAKMLTAADFRGRHSEIVDHSFDLARKHGESLIGKNDERRNDAYLERLGASIKKYGSKLEQELWRQTVDQLIIDKQDISEDYWRTQEQILRDNGQGRELDDMEREMLTEDIQKRQRESLEAWTGYLAHEECPYPLWFKVYTIDGVSKMSVFDKGKKVFRKRDRGTVAPYPHFNAAVLGKVYSAIADFYGIDNDLGARQEQAQGAQDGEEDEPTERDVELDALVRSGNFNKLYSRLLMSEKVIAKTPERAEDVRGEWVEYGVGQEEEIASAADGTPWCVASPDVARGYLVEEDDGDSRAKFILFHLQDEEGRLADNACASIRLDTDGNVAEISGLNDGQALEDSLVGVVEEKVKSLPGGEKFLVRFADKKKLIELDRKMQAGEDLSYDELRFVWEFDRPIATLDTYNTSDPRVVELREKYGLDLLLKGSAEAGEDIDELVSKLKPSVIVGNLSKLREAGANINIDELVSKLDPHTVLMHCDKLVEAGANINVDALVAEQLMPWEIAAILDKLLAAGANINIDELVSKLNSHTVLKYCDKLVEAGADVSRLMSRLKPSEHEEIIDKLLAAGTNIDVDALVTELFPWTVKRNLDRLLAAGANVDVIVSSLYQRDIPELFDKLVAAGANEAQLRAIIDGGNR